jgi:hypothetical protein
MNYSTGGGGVADWTGPVPGVGPGGPFLQAVALIKIGMEKETANTLGWLAQQHDAALKSYLLISAAEGLWNKQKPASAPKTTEENRVTMTR